MSFPTASLRPRAAEISALVFANPGAGVPLGLYWSFNIEFEPIVYYGEEMHCNLSADWVKLAVRDWRNLSESTVEGGCGTVDASFYTTAHDLATYTKLHVGRREGVQYELDWLTLIEFLGWTGNDADPQLRIQVQAKASFTGVLVHSALLGSCSSPREGAERLLAEFLDLHTFGQVVRRRNKFGMEEWRLLPE